MDILQESSASDKQIEQEKTLNLCDLAYVKTLYDAGLRIVPCGRNKRQRYKWRRDENGNYIPLTWEQLEYDFTTQESGIGILTGFDGLECLDIEDEDYFRWLEEEHSDIIKGCPVVRTPGGGIHVLYRVAGVIPKTTVYARDIAEDVLIETRGKGSYFIAPGSALFTHPSGKPYLLVKGSLTNIPTISEAAAETLHEWARSYHDGAPIAQPAEYAESKYEDKSDPSLPSNIFAEAVTWEDILLPYGWRYAGAGRWTRPGKSVSDGISASVGSSGRLMVWSSNAKPFEQNHSYSKAGALCALKFSGDWSKTVKYIMDRYSPATSPIDPDTYEADVGKQGKEATSEFIEVAVAQAKEGAELAYKFTPISAKDFAAAKYSMSWLVKKVLVRNQPTIIGGPKKSMKTNILSDLVLSLGSGTPFLGEFEVEQCRACFVSGESGEYTLQETAFRICQSKGILLEETDCFWDFRLPRLSVGEELVELSRGLAQRKIEVVVIDPLYLCLLSGGDEKNAANLFDMGPLLLEVAKACLDAGCQPLLTHHARKNLTNPEAALDLEDLAFAGVQEFARQWLLVNRREKYTPGSGHHELWMTSGGSVGHGGMWAVDINEGELQEDFTGRTWEPQVMTSQEAKEKANLKQVQKKEVIDVGSQEQLLLALDGCDQPPTKSKLNTALGWRPDKFNRIMSKLLTSGIIVLEPALVECGQGARRTFEVVRRA